MTELTTDQIVKIGIAVLVLTVVVIGAIVGFRNYIFPYFKDLGPGEREVDLSSPYYQQLIKDENLAGLTTKGSNKNFISVRRSFGSQQDFIETDYYFWKKSGEIYKKMDGEWLKLWTWTNDPFVGKADEKGIIFIDEKYRGELEVIHGAEKIGGEVYKKR